MSKSMPSPGTTPDDLCADAQERSPQSGHTPGPWVSLDDHEISVDGESCGGDQRVQSWVCIGNPAETNGEVAVVLGWAPGFDDPEQDANARLIDAAPDMLDALKGAQGIAGLIRELDDCCPSERVGLETELEAIEDAIRAAIAKAGAA